jgi:hypothetical protein
MWMLEVMGKLDFTINRGHNIAKILLPFWQSCTTILHQMLKNWPRSCRGTTNEVRFSKLQVTFVDEDL